MKLGQHPELLDRLASAYALGSLRGGARRRFESMARQSPAVRTAALLWQERFAAMTELQPADRPSANVWKRIENMIEAAPRAAVAAPGSSLLPQRLRRSLGLWRGAALVGGVATLAAVVVGLNLNQEVQRREAQLAQVGQQRETLARQNAQLGAQLQSRPDIQYVAVLADEKANASMLVTFDPTRNTLTLKRVGEFQVGADKSLELWALPPPASGGARPAGPRSLGVVEGGTVVRLAAAPGEVQDAPALAITLEPKGGVPPGSGPTGPVLFKGALLQTAV